jgi:hypothetical protein
MRAKVTVFRALTTAKLAVKTMRVRLLTVLRPSREVVSPGFCKSKSAMAKRSGYLTAASRLEEFEKSLNESIHGRRKLII